MPKFKKKKLVYLNIMFLFTFLISTFILIYCVFFIPKSDKIIITAGLMMGGCLSFWGYETRWIFKLHHEKGGKNEKDN